MSLTAILPITILPITKIDHYQYELSLILISLLVLTLVDINHYYAGEAGLEPTTNGFGDRYATNCATPLYLLCHIIRVRLVKHYRFLIVNIVTEKFFDNFTVLKTEISQKTKTV